MAPRKFDALELFEQFGEVRAVDVGVGAGFEALLMHIVQLCFALDDDYFAVFLVGEQRNTAAGFEFMQFLGRHAAEVFDINQTHRSVRCVTAVLLRV